MEPGGTHGLLLILSLPVISSYGVIAGVSDDEIRIRIVIGDRSANGDLFYESFDIHESLLLYLLPLEFNTLFGESREER
jgi:hypothetical protein